MYKYLIVFIMILVSVFTAHAGSTMINIEPTASSELWIRGKGTPFNVNCKTNDLTATLRVPADVNNVNKASHIERGMLIKIPVDVFECGIRRMNYDFREALKADKYKDIRFVLHALEEKSQDVFNVQGGLTVAGITNIISLDVQVDKISRSIFRISGSKDILMSDYEIEAPSAFFGLVSVQEELNIEFNLLVPAFNAR